MFGLLNIDKPAGMTSRDVVDAVLRLVRPEKAGHAGTLDPLATGVLVVGIGQATRLVSHVQAQRKVYQATFVLGQTSDTDDVDGDVVSLRDAPRVTRDAVSFVLPRFLGQVEQVPPRFSAIKVGGRRAYQRARTGEHVELAPRRVDIHRIEITQFEYPRFSVEIECGSGTYVRSIGRDIGLALGSGAVLSVLRRTRIGIFHVEDAVQLAELTEASLPQRLLPARAAVADLPQVVVDRANLLELHHGRAVLAANVPAVSTSGATVAVLTALGDLAAVAVVQDGRMQPQLVFC